MRTHTNLWGSWDMPEKPACRQTYNIDEVRWNLKECSCCLSDAGLLSKFGELDIFCLLMDFFFRWCFLTGMYGTWIDVACGQWFAKFTHDVFVKPNLFRTKCKWTNETYEISRNKFVKSLSYT
jgi:hypothetical protein